MLVALGVVLCKENNGGRMLVVSRWAYVNRVAGVGSHLKGGEEARWCGLKTEVVMMVVCWCRDLQCGGRDCLCLNLPLKKKLKLGTI